MGFSLTQNKNSDDLEALNLDLPEADLPDLPKMDKKQQKLTS